MRICQIILVVFVSVCSFAFAGTSAHAQIFSGTYNNATTGQQDLASATFSTFSVDGNNYLSIVLENDSTFGNYQNTDLLSGIFFSIDGLPALQPTSAVAQSLVNPSNCARSYVTVCSGTDVNVGKEWGFVDSPSGFDSTVLATDAPYGIAAVGYSQLNPTFAHATLFPVGASPLTSAKSNAPLGSLDFSLVGASFDASSSASGLRRTPLSQGNVVFNFLLPSDIGNIVVNNVTFAFGTNPNGAQVASQTVWSTSGATDAPEPAGAAVLAVGLLAVTTLRRRARVF